jgi:DDE domain
VLSSFIILSSLQESQPSPCSTKAMYATVVGTVALTLVDASSLLRSGSGSDCVDIEQLVDETDFFFDVRLARQATTSADHAHHLRRISAEPATSGRDDVGTWMTVDHSTVHRWAMKLLPVLEKVFRGRKSTVGKSWRMDETCIKVKGQWKYLYRAVDRMATPLTSCFVPDATNAQRSVISNNPWFIMACLKQ